MAVKESNDLYFFAAFCRVLCNQSVRSIHQINRIRIIQIDQLNSEWLVDVANVFVQVVTAAAAAADRWRLCCWRLLQVHQLRSSDDIVQRTGVVAAAAACGCLALSALCASLVPSVGFGRYSERLID